MEAPHKKYYDRVVRHFKEVRVWNRIVRQFPPKAIESAVKNICERFWEIYEDPEELDWTEAFDLLEDHERVADFLEELEQKRLIPVKIVEAEELASLEDLLEKLGLPKLLPPDDPYASARMEEIARELAERLEEAEHMKGRIKVKVAGKTRVWGSNRVVKFVGQLNDRIRELESEKATLVEKLERAEKAVPYVYKMVTVKFTQHVSAFMGVDKKVYGPFYANHIASIPEADAEKLVRQGTAQPWAIPTVKPTLPPGKEELLRQAEETFKRLATAVEHDDYYDTDEALKKLGEIGSKTRSV